MSLNSELTLLKIFRWVALIEAISSVLLFFIAMPLKYCFDQPEWVRIVGLIHGILVVIFFVLLLLCWNKSKWKFQRVVLYGVISIIPVVSFWIERDVKKDIDRLKYQ